MQTRFRAVRSLSAALWSLCLGIGMAQSQIANYLAPGWHSSGQNLANTRSQFAEFGINTGNVKNLHMKWVFAAGGQVTATPTVADGLVYFPDSAGNLFAVHKEDGTVLWSHKMADYTGVAGAVSRTSPLVHGKHLFVGDQLANTKTPRGANVMSINGETGALEWITRVESQTAAKITGSPILYNGVLYVGVSSSEEGLAEQASYPCCTFRGSVVALDAANGRVFWKTYTVPDNGSKQGGYSGGSVWAPPAVDIARQTLYVGTADNYTVPEDVAACQRNTPEKNCVAANDYFDSLLALDLRTGHVKWAQHMRTFDTYTLACITPSAPRAYCQVPASPDSGSGSGPNLIGDTVGVGQKDGTYWAFNAVSGKVLWTTQVGPGSNLGGILWGTATDGTRIYVANANGKNQSYVLKPSGEATTWGYWSALDVHTGKILWQTPDPTKGTSDIGAVSEANGVVYAGSNSGHMYAINSVNGRILWNFNSGGAVLDGPSIVNRSLYWGCGYSAMNNNKVFAFDLP